MSPMSVRCCNVYWKISCLLRQRSAKSFLGYIIQSGQVKVDSEKISGVTEWPQPTTRKQLQRFIGFANFFWRFIKDFSRVAAPLTKLTSIPFTWTPKAEAAFQALKTLFSSASILIQPDPSWQFVVEVDVSDTGVGAVLSQRHESTQKLHPCAFLPWGYLHHKITLLYSQ